MESLTYDEAYEFLQTALVAHIGVITDDGSPYVTPMSFVTDDDRILFRTKPGRRLESIRKDGRVSIEASRFDEELGDWISVIVIGKATVGEDQALADRAVQLLMTKYQRFMGSPLGISGLQPMADFPVVVSVEIEEITGMSSGRGFAARTRPGRL